MWSCCCSRRKCCDRSCNHAVRERQQQVDKLILLTLRCSISLSLTHKQAFLIPETCYSLRTMLFCVWYECVCFHLLSVLSDGRSRMNEKRGVSVCVLQKTCRPILTATHTLRLILIGILNDWHAHTLLCTYARAHALTRTHTCWSVLTGILSVWL